jgi:hypothetical protein
MEDQGWGSGGWEGDLIGQSNYEYPWDICEYPENHMDSAEQDSSTGYGPQELECSKIQGLNIYDDSWQYPTKGNDGNGWLTLGLLISRIWKG